MAWRKADLGFLGIVFLMLGACSREDSRARPVALGRNEVEAIFEVFHKVYEPVLKPAGKVIQFKYLEGNNLARTKPIRGGMLIEVYSNLTKMVNGDELAWVLCHEAGHNVGGAPLHGDQQFPGVEMSSEGQADYHAARSCIRRILEAIPERQVPQVAPFIQKKCAEGFGTSGRELNFCVRALDSAMFIKKLARGARISFETPDPKVVQKTHVGYPGARGMANYPSDQCRLDTYLAGYFQQERPRCWYNPADNAGYHEVFGQAINVPGGTPSVAPGVNDLAGHSLESDVRNAMARGLIRGYGDGTFRPGAGITRLETGLLLTKFSQLATQGRLTPPQSVSEAPYSDIPQTEWFAPAISFTKAHDLITNMTDGSFRPSHTVNRGYFTVSLYKTVKLVLATLQAQPIESLQQGGQEFPELSGHWSQVWAKRLSGFCNAAFADSGAAFEPEGEASRGYAAAAAVRAFDCIRQRAR